MKEKWTKLQYAQAGVPDKHFVILMPIRGGDGMPLNKDAIKAINNALALDKMYPIPANSLIN